MSDPEPDSTPDGDTQAQVNIDYIKGNYFRTIRPDGAIAGRTPTGEIQLAFFSERQAIPQRMVHKLEDDGTLGGVIESIGRDAVVRELDIVVTVDQDLAVTLARFLLDRLTEAGLMSGEENTK